MQRIKATTESWEPEDLNNSSTARSDQRKDSQWPRGILSTWELPTQLQYTVPGANRQLHLLLPTHEMWELPTPLIAANKPNRAMRDMGVTRSASKGHGNYPHGLEHSILRTRPSSLLNLTADRNWGQIHRQLKLSQLKFPLANRSCNRPHPKPKQISTNSNDVAENYCHNWTRHPLLTTEQLTNICSQRNIRSLTQLKLTQLTAESSSLTQNAVVPTNPNDDVLAPATKHASALSTAQRQQILLRLLNTTTQRQLLTSPLLNANIQR
ncbi:Cysteine protein [Dorcoceras hygrometricum]|uniref:Cysteine protein n=1 Tax=Dorcoceras hygrometricum TaxID=472368 RepID=A0A2Z7AN57_9LAMI|nr:Cysteine protein [Dorcoceras hygrometricum]